MTTTKNLRVVKWEIHRRFIFLLLTPSSSIYITLRQQNALKKATPKPGTQYPPRSFLKDGPLFLPFPCFTVCTYFLMTLWCCSWTGNWMNEVEEIFIKNTQVVLHFATFKCTLFKEQGTKLRRHYQLFLCAPLPKKQSVDQSVLNSSFVCRVSHGILQFSNGREKIYGRAHQHFSFSLCNSQKTFWDNGWLVLLHVIFRWLIENWQALWESFRKLSSTSFNTRTY